MCHKNLLTDNLSSTLLGLSTIRKNQKKFGIDAILALQAYFYLKVKGVKRTKQGCLVPFQFLLRCVDMEFLTGVFMFSLTAQSKVDISFFGYGSQTHTLADLVAKRHPLLAFCQKCSQSSLVGGHSVSRLGIAVLKKVKSSATHCPDCGHALFWSINYRPLTDDYYRQDSARRQNGLPSLIP